VLYVKSEKLKFKIEKLVDEVTNVFSNIRFEEFIVVCDINNMIMLRFDNVDLNEISYNDLIEREKVIRSIVWPDFLANFMGSNYEKFGLNLRELSTTLGKCNDSLQEAKLSIKPSYFYNVEKDSNKLKAIIGGEIKLWEYQVHGDSVDILYFTDSIIEKYRKNDIDFYPLKYDFTYKGIIKAELQAIVEETSLCEILLRYQDNDN
jgi:hypothetical protein